MNIRAGTSRISALLLLALLAGCGAAARPARRPSAPLAVLDESALPLRADFDRSPGAARLLALVSPT